jgi:hypothetical protein
MWLLISVPINHFLLAKSISNYAFGLCFIEVAI